MKKILQSVLITILFLFKITIIIASSKTTSDSIEVKYYFNPIVKTATKVAGPQRDLAASITSINFNDIEQTPASTVLEIVRDHVPGLYITERGVMGYGVADKAAGKISIRGLGGGAATHVLILRNGRPDFMGLMGCTIADEIGMEGIEKIEVLRGPASFIYGTNAIGGVINIVSKSMTEDGFKTQIKGGYGTYDSQKFSASHGGKKGNLEYYLTASTQKTNGHRSFSDYSADHYTVHLGYGLGYKTYIEVNASFADINLSDPGTESEPFINHWYDIRRYGGDLTVVNKNRFGESNIKFHGNFGFHRFFDGWQSRDRTMGIVAYHNIKPWTGNTTTVGFDIKQYGGSEESTDNGKEFSITEYAPYIHTQQLLLKRIIASAGVRIEHHDLFGFETLPKIGLVSHLRKKTSIRISAAKGFRSPSIRELYFWVMKNPELEPERLWNYEIGVTQHIDNRLKLEAALFRVKGDNMIRKSNPGFPFQWINSGEFTHTGYEVLLQWLPVDCLELHCSWSKLDLGNETQNAPGKKVTAFLTYKIWRMTFSCNAVHVMDLYGEDYQQKPMRDYTVVDVAAKVFLFNPVSMKITVKNALDKKYESMYGYPMPGRYFSVDLSYNF